MNVLIAEDDAASRFLLQASVENLGHACLPAADGVEAWDVIRNSRVDVVISDWMMPRMDGVELCRRVREYERGTSTYTYFIFATALGEKEHFLAAMREGADDYLTKPLDPIDLRARLNAATRVMALYRELETHKVELESLSDRLSQGTDRDPLTRLDNRRRLREDLVILLGRVHKHRDFFSLVLCDTDYFETFQDAQGNTIGEEFLLTVAKSLREQCEAGDALYRYGPSEFMILLWKQDRSAAEATAERIRAVVRDLPVPYLARDRSSPIPVTTAVTSVVPDGDVSPDDVLRELDSDLSRLRKSIAQ